MAARTRAATGWGAPDEAQSQARARGHGHPGPAPIGSRPQPPSAREGHAAGPPPARGSRLPVRAPLRTPPPQPPVARDSGSPRSAPRPIWPPITPLPIHSPLSISASPDIRSPPSIAFLICHPIRPPSPARSLLRLPLASCNAISPFSAPLPHPCRLSPLPPGVFSSHPPLRLPRTPRRRPVALVAPPAAGSRSPDSPQQLTRAPNHRLARRRCRQLLSPPPPICPGPASLHGPAASLILSGRTDAPEALHHSQACWADARTLACLSRDPPAHPLAFPSSFPPYF